VIDQSELTEIDAERRLQVEYWPLDRLIPNARNARTHSDAQIAEIAGSIRAFGFSSPILVSGDGDVIAGHGRLSAARKLGMIEAPVVVLRGLALQPKETSRISATLTPMRVRRHAVP
jgi:ParB-like chromosome segregation protein Spo0J